MIHCCIIVPVYDHPDTLAALAQGLAATGLPTLLVNDGSGARCSELLRELAQQFSWITLIERSTNGGKGAAVKTGLQAAAEQGYSHALQLDADGQHDHADIPRLLALAEQYPQAVITGIPEFQGVPALRFYGRYLTHLWVWINTLSLEIRDSMCGFRVYPLASTLRVLAQANTGNRMDFDPEILVRLHWEGVPLVQLPTPVRFPADGISHFRGLQDNALISWAHTRLFFGMLSRLPRLLRQRRAAHAR